MVSQQHLLSEKLVLLIPPCLIVDLFVSNLQVDVTCLEIRGMLPPTRAAGLVIAWSILEPGVISFFLKEV